jgi:hypothetical protein
LANQCQKKLEMSENDSLVSHFPFKGTELVCDKESCFWGMKRERHHRARVPIFYATKKSAQGQIIDEYNLFLQAYEINY